MNLEKGVIYALVLSACRFRFKSSFSIAFLRNVEPQESVYIMVSCMCEVLLIGRYNYELYELCEGLVNLGVCG